MPVTGNSGSDFGLEWCRPIANRGEKERIGAVVAARVKSGQTIGAGSGSSSYMTLVEIAKRVKADRLDVLMVPTSHEIQFACEAMGLRVAASLPSHIDWCFDGADEVDPRGRLIKGRGGAMYRERLVFYKATQRLIVADSSKTVDRLGSKFPVPVEVDPACARSAFEMIGRFEHVTEVVMRLAAQKDGPVITEGGGIILDVRFSVIDDDDEGRMLAVPGVRCTGMFTGASFERIGDD